MRDLPKYANVVIIGARFVGNSIAYHLAKLDWKDMVILFKESAKSFNKLSKMY